METGNNDTLYVFIDESGNLDFGPKGTDHYVLAAVVTKRPLLSSSKLQDLKYRYLEDGVNVEYFHASEDRQFVRNTVIARINGMGNDISVNYVHTKKCKTGKTTTNPAMFYAELGVVLSSEIIERRAGDFDRVLIIFDRCLRGKDQNAFLKAIKPRLNKFDILYHIYFHRTLSDFNGQIADYFAWAKYVALERGEHRPLAAMTNIEQADFYLKNDHPAYL